MKSMPGLLKLVQHLANYVEAFGKWNETWYKAEMPQIRGAANTIIRLRNLDSLPMALLYAYETWTVYQWHAKDWTTSIQAVLENF